MWGCSALSSSLLIVLLAIFSATAAGKRKRSNIVWIMGDDHDIELGGLTPMNKTRKLLGEGGAVGEAFYVTTPICMQSRTAYLTGRNYHNILLPDASPASAGGHGGNVNISRVVDPTPEAGALLPSMQNAGYTVGAFGKVMNGQGNLFCANTSWAVSAGFDWLSVPCNEGDYFGSSFWNRRPDGSTWKESLGPPSVRAVPLCK